MTDGDTSAYRCPLCIASDASTEWDYRTIDGQFGQSFRTSIPCQLRFVEATTQDTDAFHAALEANGYTAIGRDSTRAPDESRSGKRPYYNGKLMADDHYTRVRVRVYRGNVVRLYPYDDRVPPRPELAGIIDALQQGFDASLEHDPID